MTMAKTTPSSSSARNLATLAPPPPPPPPPPLPQAQTLNNPPAASDTHHPFTSQSSPGGGSLTNPSSSVADARRGKRGDSIRAWVAAQERRIEMEVIRAICSGRADSLKPNSGKGINIGEHYICVSVHDGVDPDCRTWEWHGHVMTGENNGYMPERIYGSYLERVNAEGWYDEEDEERTEDSSIPIVVGNVTLRLNRFN
ncbi:uncharacterized protein LOC115687246 isoform X2 [Syzygium oleosum]|uniref:uncharacterized protein LOC115687246 isoform X2 n=1 Tax=Syzygium oleosum TaxID=219896 RepID=UPI0024B9F573|nr:uncharacterized protein LOC115687246 isoform X2 [Syzygium oleosum]